MRASNISTSDRLVSTTVLANVCINCLKPSVSLLINLCSTSVLQCVAAALNAVKNIVRKSKGEWQKGSATSAV